MIGLQLFRIIHSSIVYDVGSIEMLPLQAGSQEITEVKYVLLVTGPAYGTQQTTSAYLFAKALLAAGHQLSMVFFHQEGVSHANAFIQPAGDEHHMAKCWIQLSQQYQISLNVCVAASLRRGITQPTADIDQGNVNDGFQLAGLGALAQAALTCDRLVQF